MAAMPPRERNPRKIRTTNGMARLRDAAYNAKLSWAPVPSRPATANDALTIALIVVMAAHIQNALGVFSLLGMVCLKGVSRPMNWYETIVSLYIAIYWMCNTQISRTI